MTEDKKIASRQSMQLLGMVAQLYTARMDTLLAQDNLTLAQFSMLMHLSRYPRPQRISDIARAMGVKQPFITKAIAKFESSALVTVSGDPQDARSRLVAIRPEGHALLAQIRTGLAPDVDKIFDLWKDKEIKRLNEYLGKLTQWYDQNRL